MVTSSRVESEYKSLISASAKLAWLQSLFSKIGGCCMEKPIVCYDNISATKLARNPIYHSKTKHIEIDTHFIENKVLVGELNIQYIPSCLTSPFKTQGTAMYIEFGSQIIEICA